MKVALIQPNGRVYDVLSYDAFLDQASSIPSGWLTDIIDDAVSCSIDWLRAAIGVYQDIPEPPPDFNQTLQNKLDAIDSVTDALIMLGHEFPPSSGDHYSLSLQAQLMLLGLAGSPNTIFPIAWWTLDSAKELLLPDASTFLSFFQSAFAVIKVARFSGMELRRQSHACETVNDLAAIVDSRLSDPATALTLAIAYATWLAENK